MVGKTFKKAIAKAVASATTAALCAGCFCGISFAASPTEPSASLLLDHDTDILSLVMDSAQEDLEQDPYENIVVSNYEPYLSIYEDANAASEVVGKLYPGAYGEIVEKGDQWTKITSGDVTGYVLSEDVAFGDDAKKLAQDMGKTVAKVTVDDLNIRSDPNFYSTVIASGKKDETYRIVPEGSEYDEDTGKIQWTTSQLPVQSAGASSESTQETDSNIQKNNSEDVQDEAADESTVPSYEQMIEPITDVDGGQWYRIHLDDIYYGYVYADCVDIETQLDDAVTLQEEAQAQLEDAAEQTATASDAKTEDQSQTSPAQTETTQSQTSKPAQTETAQNQTSKPAQTETSQSQTSEPAQTQPPQTDAPQTETPSVPETDAPSSATTDDAYLLACIVYCEAGNQSYEGQLAVANVVLNRVKSPLFPNTVSEVIYQSGQFGPVYSGTLDQTLANGPSSACVQAANDALAGNNNIGNLLFFNNVAPSGAVSVTTIGDIVFYTYNY